MQHAVIYKNMHIICKMHFMNKIKKEIITDRYNLKYDNDSLSSQLFQFQM